MSTAKFDFQAYAEPARWLTTIYRVRHIESGQHLGSVASGAMDWVILHDEGGMEGGFGSRQAAANRLLVLAGLDPVSAAALPADPFEGLAPKGP